MRNRVCIWLAVIPALAAGLSSRARAQVNSPQWLESGMNLVWISDGGFQPALTFGVGRDWANTTPAWSINNPPFTNQYAPMGRPVPLTGSTPLDGGQYFCYMVNGNVATDGGALPSNYSFACSEVQPYADLSPSSALTSNGRFTVNEWDAGFVGSIFWRGDGGWNPWFRNGQQVLYDMPLLNTQALNDGGVSGLNPPVDPSSFLSAVTFTHGGAATQTIDLPPIFAAGDLVELELTNGVVAFGPNTAPPAQIQILTVDQTSQSSFARCIGEATVGPVDVNPGVGAGSPRVASYRIDISDLSSNYGVILDMTAKPPVAGQVVTAAVVLHGYHEPLK